MRITDQMVVPQGTPEDAADVRRCEKCKEKTFFSPQTVNVFSKGGARRMRLWTCEVHRLPDVITDEPSEEA